MKADLKIPQNNTTGPLILSVTHALSQQPDYTKTIKYAPGKTKRPASLHSEAVNVTRQLEVFQ